MLSHAFTEEFNNHISGLIGGVSIGEIKGFSMLLPTYEEQQQIADYLESKCAKIDKLIAAKTHLITEMESYKKSVIYEYVTGKKEVVL